MKELLLCIFALHVTTAKSVIGGELTEFSFNPHQVYGKYVSGVDEEIHGITFLSKADDYLLTSTLSGKTVVERVLL